MLEIIDLNASYGKRQVLFDINTSIDRGKFTAIIGRNGSGKSSFLASIASIKSFSGRILLEKRDISELSSRERAKKLSYLPQSLPATQFTVFETVAFGREPYTSFKLTEADVEIIEQAIEKCGISSLKGKRIGEISGGERQTAYLAMMIAQDADIMLLDEPTTYMDAPNAREFMKIITDERDKGKSVVAVMHDLGQAVRHADNVILIDSGKIVFAGSVEEAISSKVIEKIMGVEAHRLNDGSVVFV